MASSFRSQETKSLNRKRKVQSGNPFLATDESASQSKKIKIIKPSSADGGTGTGDTDDSDTGGQANCSSSTSSSMTPKNKPYLNDVTAFILQAGLGKVRTDIFKKQMTAHGAEVMGEFDSDLCTHIIVDEGMDSKRLLRLLRLDEPPRRVAIVKARWLSLCLSEKKLIPTDDYTLYCPFPVVKNDPLRMVKEAKPDETCEKKAEKLSNVTSSSTSAGSSKWTSLSKAAISDTGYDSNDSNYIPSDGDDDAAYQDNMMRVSTESEESTSPATSPQKLPKGNWVCSRPSSSQSSNLNEHITDKLEMLMKTYTNTNDHWRSLGYRKAITALKQHKKKVTSWEEANSLTGIGTRLADKIWEIIESGRLRKIDHVCGGDDMKALDLFNNIWGAGPTVAQEWVQLGFRTLEDIQTKARLNRQQKIGLKHYEDFLQRMPREEASQIEQTVRAMAVKIDPDMMAVVCGSFRRGKKTCGDVDVLVTHPDGKTHRGALGKILDGLREDGFITDDLVRQSADEDDQKKYMGVCKLPGQNQKYRRLDIIVAPYSQYYCALVHFTGSGHFNRSIRLLAKKKGMSLSEHALRTGVIRRGNVKVHEGMPLPVTCEEDIFRHLGLEYRTPEERDY